MITHPHRGRLTVDTDGDWRLYTTAIPSGAEAIGVVSRGQDDERGIGALVRLRSGNYVQINGGALRTLDGRAVAAALGQIGGRPAKIDGGKRVNTYLDAESIAIAEGLGNGNVSDGIRQALKQTRKNYVDASGKIG